MNDYTPKEVVSLMNLVDTYKRWKNFTTQGDRSYEYHHPSSFGKCARAEQYKHFAYKGYIKVIPKELESQQLRLFDKGHAMHHRWSNYFTEMGVLRGRWQCKNKLCNIFDDNGILIPNTSQEKISKLLDSNESRIHGDKNILGDFRPTKCCCGCKDFYYVETPVVDLNIGFKGNADLIVDCSRLTDDSFKGVRRTFDIRLLPKDGKVIVIDMKTVGKSAWDFQLIKRGPHKEYLIQLTIYIHILGCDYGVLAYENKNDSNMLWYKVERNDEWWDVLKWQSQMMMDMATKKQLPPPKYDSKDDYACKKCDFQKLCHSSPDWDRPDFNKFRQWFYKCLL